MQSRLPFLGEPSSRRTESIERALVGKPKTVYGDARRETASFPQTAWDRPFHRKAHRDVPTLHSTPLLPCTVRSQTSTVLAFSLFDPTQSSTPSSRPDLFP